MPVGDGKTHPVLHRLAIDDFRGIVVPEPSGFVLEAPSYRIVLILEKWDLTSWEFASG